MKIGLFSPYLPKHYGGGERHMLTTAWYVSTQHDVELLLPIVDDATRSAMRKYEELFGLDLSRVKLIPSPLASGQGNALSNWLTTKSYDAFFFLTDGSLFLSGAKRSILHIQVPYTHQQNGVISRLKLQSWNIKNANSLFTQSVVEKAWNTSIPFVHYPYADTSAIEFNPHARRERKIVAVGRFMDPTHTDLQAKRQDALVEAFRLGCERHEWKERGWELHLVGAVEPAPVHREFVKRLEKLAKGFPIFFHHDVSYKQLGEMYDKASLFWHAAGLGVNETLEPQRVEHFGMTTIEAMAHGCIPLVVNRGGLKESVQHAKNGFLFESIGELTQLTNQTMNLSSIQKRDLRIAARKRAQFYSLESFCTTIDQMLEAA